MKEVPRRQRTIEEAQDDVRKDTLSEIEFHIGMRAEELMRSGMSGEAARAQARTEFGADERVRAQLMTAEMSIRRGRRRRRLLGDVGFDFRYALRQLRSSWSFTAVALGTLGLGIGATVAIFSIVNAYLLQPMPFPGPDRLVVVNDHQPSYGNAPASLPELEEWREQATSFEVMTGIFRRSRTFLGSDYPEQVRVGFVTDGFLELTGARAVAGRLLTAADHATGAPPVVVLTESFWSSRFGGDRRIVGSPIVLGGTSYMVVGVAAPVADFSTGEPLVAWSPLEPDPLSTARGMHFISVQGRLRPGVSQTQAQAELESIAARSNAASGNDHTVVVQPMRELLVGNARPMLMAMLAIVVFVLLIAALNVANLLLARAASREQEFAVRNALGAGRTRLVRQLVVEGLVLSLAGCTLGLVIGWAGQSLLLRSLPASMPRPATDGFDATVLMLALALVIGTTMLFALAPAAMQLRGRMGSVLRSARGTGAADGRLLRQSVIVVELAMSMALLVGAALMIQSFVRLSRVELGYEPAGLLSSVVNLSPRRYDSPERIQQFTADLERSLVAIPGVRRVAFATNLPISSGMNGSIRIFGTYSGSDEDLPMTEKRWVSHGWLETMGIELREGRFFDDRDVRGSQRVVVINETMAHRLWPGESAIGRRINSASEDGEWEEIIGVVEDVRAWGIDQPPPLEVLHSLQQDPSGGFNVVLRVEGDAEQAVLALRRTVRELDPQLPVQSISLVSDALGDAVAGRRLLLVLAVAFGALAVLLAGIGTAGLIAYGIARRTRELGLRLALGARPAQVLSLVLSEGVALAVIGMLIGIVIALFNGQLLRSQLFEVQATDGVAYAAAIGTLTLATLLAAWLPARRVLKIDPMSAMRLE